MGLDVVFISDGNSIDGHGRDSRHVWDDVQCVVLYGISVSRENIPNGSRECTVGGHPQ